MKIGNTSSVNYNGREDTNWIGERDVGVRDTSTGYAVSVAATDVEGDLGGTV